eukprot:COSAG01_NODE_69843_length_260_cov_0.645963_1_plen_60_part_10
MGLSQSQSTVKTWLDHTRFAVTDTVVSRAELLPAFPALPAGAPAAVHGRESSHPRNMSRG